MRTEPNAYSPRWFEFFHANISEARTMQETAFICRCTPLPDFRKVLDMCCGMGRHARTLSKRGYLVTGIDRDVNVIAKARGLAGGPTYMNADIRHYRPANRTFDIAVIMSQSFGYFDAATNRDALRRLAEGVREGGRVILDLWNPDFFVTHQGRYEFKTGSGIVQETKRVEDNRLFVHLDYPDGGQDNFEWQLLSPARMISMAASMGLSPLLTCTNFDETTRPSPTNPRIQFLFERCRG
jgi:SAM-dependent methyltransferase